MTESGSTVVYTHEDLSAKDGVAYGMEGQESSVVQQGGGETTVYKDAGPWGSPSAGYAALSYFRGLGFTGAPSSPASIYRALYTKAVRSGDLPVRVMASANHELAPGVRVGWIESRRRGVVKGPLWHYDINSAFLWAGMQGLPLRVYPYTAGAERYTVLMDIRHAKRDLPAYMKGVKTVTDEDIRYYGLQGKRLGGVQYDELDYNPIHVLEAMGDAADGVYKGATQSYWGVHAQRAPLRCRTRKGGKVTKRWTQYNREQNICWAAIIGSRVTRKVHSAMEAGGILTFVDSVLMPYELRTGPNVGQWKLVESFPQGVYIKSAGVWDRLYDHSRRHHRVSGWYRHAGYAQHTPAEQ